MLTWSSIGNELQNSLSQSGKRLRLVICPFIQRNALVRLLDRPEWVDGLQVITRWNGADLIAGVSDIAIYPYLRDRKIPLFVHSRIHLKLHVFEDGSAFLGSGNVTQTGLGWSDRPNVEVGSLVQLTGGDWAQVNKILRDSSRVDQDLYNAAVAYKEKHGMPVPSLPEFNVRSSVVDGFSLLDLPSAAAPADLLASIGAMRDGGPSAPELMHDLDLLGLNVTQHASDLILAMFASYRQLPPVQGLVGWLSKSGSLSFGEVTQWLHSRLIDRPVPYRTDAKTAVANLYRWLPLAFEAITVGRPNHSEILYFSKLE